MKSIFLLFCTSLLISSSCNKEKESECPPDRMCTMDFRSVTVQLTRGGQPYQLDTYVTKRNSDSLLINIQNSIGHFEDSLYRSRGIYPVLTDGQMNLTAGQGSTFTFIGYINNQEVIRESYVIGNDCCHINKISGRSQIVF